MDAPAAEGVRVDWQDLPAPVREAVQEVCGSRVVEATTQAGGFSPGVAARLLREGGRRYFVKAVSSAANPMSPDMHRQEAQVLRALDLHIRCGDVPAPKLIGTVEQDTWTGLVLTHVDGQQPRLPWEAGQPAEVLDTLDQMAAVLTPAPSGLPGIADELECELTGWRTLASAPALDGLDPGSRTNLEDLSGLEAEWVATRGKRHVLTCALLRSPCTTRHATDFGQSTTVADGITRHATDFGQSTTVAAWHNSPRDRLRSA